MRADSYAPYRDLRALRVLRSFYAGAHEIVARRVRLVRSPADMRATQPCRHRRTSQARRGSPPMTADASADAMLGSTRLHVRLFDTPAIFAAMRTGIASSRVEWAQDPECSSITPQASYPATGRRVRSVPPPRVASSLTRANNSAWPKAIVGWLPTRGRVLFSLPGGIADRAFPDRRRQTSPAGMLS